MGNLILPFNNSAMPVGVGHSFRGARGLTLSSLEIGSVDATTLVVVFSKPVTAVGDDYTTGVTIKVDGSTATIVSGTRQASTHIVYYVLQDAIVWGSAVTIEYTSTTGKITDVDSVALATFSATTVTNNVADTAPTYASAEVGTVDVYTVVVTFSELVSAADLKAGVTIKNNTVAQTILSAAYGANHAVVNYVLTDAVASDNTVTWEYAKASGSLISEDSSTALENVTAQTVTNNVPGGETTIFLDTFTGANGTNLTAHTPDLNGPGNPWTALYSTLSLNGSGQAAKTGGEWTSKYAIDVAQNALEIVARINTGQVANTFNGPGLALHMANDGNYGVLFQLRTGGPAVGYAEWSGGTDQNVGLPIFDFPYTLADNTYYWLRCVSIGNSLILYVADGTPTAPEGVTWSWLGTIDGYQYHNLTGRSFATLNNNSSSTLLGIGTGAGFYVTPLWDYLEVKAVTSPKRLVWFGDSLVANYGNDAATANPYSRTVPGGYHNGYCAVANLATPGSGVLMLDAYLRKWRDQIAAAPTNADFPATHVLINHGVNDNDWTATWDNEADYDIGQIKAKYPAASIYWVGMPPYQGGGAGNNGSISAACVRNSITYIDTSESGMVAGDYTDGIHLKPSGNEKMRAVILAAL